MIMVLLTLSALQFRSFSAVAARTRGYHLPPSRGQTLRCFTLSSQVSRGSTHPCLLPHMNLRGGSQDGDYSQSKTREFSSPIRSGDQKYVKLSDPAPGSRKFVTDVIVILLIQVILKEWTSSSLSTQSISLCISCTFSKGSKTFLWRYSRLPRRALFGKMARLQLAWPSDCMPLGRRRLQMH